MIALRAQQPTSVVPPTRLNENHTVVRIVILATIQSLPFPRCIKHRSILVTGWNGSAWISPLMTVSICLGSAFFTAFCLFMTPMCAPRYGLDPRGSFSVVGVKYACATLLFPSTLHFCLTLYTRWEFLTLGRFFYFLGIYLHRRRLSVIDETRSARS